MSALGIPYLQTPAHIVNQSLDRIGRPKKIIGDITDGSDVAEAARRNYGQLLRLLLATAHWDFARKQAPLTLLADATGQTPDVSTCVEGPWTYAYAWPIDGVSAIWLPWAQPQTPVMGCQPGNGAPPPSFGESAPGVPLMGGGTVMLAPIPNIPGRFLVSSSSKYPVEVGQNDWVNQPDLQRTQGVGPVNRRIILTDVRCAELVYTRLVTTIEEWDPGFREAFVMLLALTLIPVAIEDPKERMTERSQIIPMAKNAIADARVANGNSAGFPQTTEHLPNWITARNGGLLGYGRNAGLSGYFFCPYDASMAWAGSVF